MSIYNNYITCRMCYLIVASGIKTLLMIKYSISSAHACILNIQSSQETKLDVTCMSGV